MTKNKDKQIRELKDEVWELKNVYLSTANYYRRFWFVSFIVAYIFFMGILYFFSSQSSELHNLEQQLQSYQDKVPETRCYFINEVTTRYWIPEEGLIVGQNTYIENITEENCEVIE